MFLKPTTTNEYISSFPATTQVLLQQVRAAIRKAVPEAVECISYGIPTFKLNGNLVHFAGYKNHIGFYPGADSIAAFAEELSGYKSAKGSVQFPIDKKMPLTLIGRIVKYRVKQQKKEVTSGSFNQRGCKGEIDNCVTRAVEDELYV